jgi:hypothetical protein
MREAEMQEVWTRTNLIHPLNLRALKGNEDQDYVLEQPVYDH